MVVVFSSRIPQIVQTLMRENVVPSSWHSTS